MTSASVCSLDMEIFVDTGAFFNVPELSDSKVIYTRQFIRLDPFYLQSSPQVFWSMLASYSCFRFMMQIFCLPPHPKGALLDCCHNH